MRSTLRRESFGGVAKIEFAERGDMGRTISLLGFCGSSRAQSHNGSLLRGMARRLEAAGVSVEVAALRDFPMPIYDGDLEAAKGVPTSASALRRKIMEHDGFVIACPEHNGSISALLKNTLDWCSRPSDGIGGLEPFHRKPALIVGTSVSPFGALRGLGHLRAILCKMGALVYPEDLAVPDGANAITPDGVLLNAEHGAAADRLCHGFQDFASAMARATA